MIGTGWAEAGYLPEWTIRRGIRWMLRDRLRGLDKPDRKRRSEPSQPSSTTFGGVRWR